MIKLIIFLCFLNGLVLELKCDNVTEQLDALDEVMAEELNAVPQNNEAKEDQCVQPKLGFCKDDVNYKIAKAQSALHSFYDGLVETGLDSLTIETKGSMLSCKRELKRLMCRDRFPRCSNGKVFWNNGAKNCGKVLEKCPQNVRDKLGQFDFCNKLNKGRKDINSCMSPLIMSDMKYCSIKKSDKVSPWNLHSAIEVNGLLDMQTSLWSLSKQCVSGLSKYLCFPATLCNRNEAGNLLKKYNALCKEAIQSCSNEVISKALTDIFLKC